MYRQIALAVEILSLNFILEDPSDADVCSLSYRGPSPCSELECYHIRKYVFDLIPVPVLATSLHSYGQVYMWPYGYHPNAVAENSHELEGLAIDAVSALDVINSLSTRAPIRGKNNQCHFEARLQNNHAVAQCHFEARLQNEACRQGFKANFQGEAKK